MNDAALDIGRDLAPKVGQVVAVVLKHTSRCGSEWAARRYRTLLFGVVKQVLEIVSLRQVLGVAR